MFRRSQRQVRVVEFREENPDRVVQEMARMGEAHRGWLNLRPVLPEDEEPPPPAGLAAVFSGPVYEVPVCTWVAGKVGHRGVERDSLGIQHASGTRTALQLRTLGVAVPPGWRVVQDHPRRGLVVQPPVGTDHSDLLVWLLRASTALSRVPLRGDWVAEVHLPA